MTGALLLTFVAAALQLANPSASFGAIGAPSAARPSFAAADILKLQGVSDVKISPDGRRIVFIRHAVDVMRDRYSHSLWVVSVDGGPPRQLVPGEAGEPHWSPDSDNIAYLAKDANGRTQVQSVSRATGAHAVVTHMDQSPGELAWSPDGRRIAFTAFVPGAQETLAQPLEKPPGATWAPPLRFTTAKHVFADGSDYLSPGHTHLFMVDATGGPVRQLTFGSNEDSGPTWRPDGAALVYSSYNSGWTLRDFGLNRLYQVDIAGGAVSRLSPDPIDAKDAAVSPDGRHIAFIGWASPHPWSFFKIQVYVMDSDGSHLRVLDPSLDRLVHGLRWAADSRSVLFGYDDHGIAKIAQGGLDGSFKVLAEDAVDEFSASRTGALAFSLGAAEHPPEVGLARDGRTQRLTFVSEPLLSTLSLSTVRPLSVRSSFDGAEVGAWMVLPPGYDPKRRYPTIVELHGGPYGDDGPYWRTEFQILAGAGYVVLDVNYRGSTSYGLKFSSAIDRNFPGPAPFDDVMSAVNAAVAAGVADPSSLYVTGGSAGGELTAWVVGHTRRFRAAVAEKPVIDQTSNALDSDQYLFGADAEWGATPWSDPSIFWNHSPLAFVGDVSTPTLLVVGDKDRRTGLGQSLEFYHALKIRGVPTGLVIAPDASHESLESRPSQGADIDLDLLAWFARYHGPTTGSGK